MRQSICTAFLVASILGGIAVAAPISPDVTITGDIAYDTGNSFSDQNASHSGSMFIVVGGSSSFTDFTDGSIGTGSNPLPSSPATFTDTGDGAGLTEFVAGSVGDFGDEWFAGVDILMTLTNNSLTDTYEVVFGVRYTNIAIGEQNVGLGDDAYAQNEFTVDEDGSEVFFTEVLSDLLFGDELRGVNTGTFGDTITDSGTDSFTVSLAPGATVIIDGAFTSEGAAYGVVEDDAFASFDGFLSIDEVNNITRPIPEPGTVALLGLGLLGVAGAAVQRRRKKVA